MSGIYRVVYGGVCELIVEAQDQTITKILAASSTSEIIGLRLDELPKPTYVEVKLLAEYAA